MDTFKQSAEFLKAMAHPERLRLLAALCDGEQCVCHLTALLAQRQPYVSQQLTYLRQAGLLADRKEGLRVYYHIASPRVSELVKSLGLNESGALHLRNCACPTCTAHHETMEELCCK